MNIYIFLKIITTKQNTFILILKKSINNYMNVVHSTSLGKCGFKGKHKKTKYAYFLLVRKVLNFLLELNNSDIFIDIFVNEKGIYSSFILTLILNSIQKNTKFHICSISENMRIPFNGCKLPKICYK